MPLYIILFPFHIIKQPGKRGKHHVKRIDKLKRQCPELEFFLFHESRDSPDDRIVDEGLQDDVKHVETPENRHEKASHEEEDDAQIEQKHR